MNTTKFRITFCLFHLVVCLFFQDLLQLPNPNVLSRILPAISLHEDGVLDIDKYHRYTGDKSLIDGHYYSDKAPMVTFLTYSLYALVEGTVAPQETTAQKITLAQLLAGLLAGTLPFVMFVHILYQQLVRLEWSQPVLWSTLLAYGGFVFLYSSVAFGHLLAAVLVLWGYQLYSRKKYYCSGLLFGATFLCDYPVILFVLPLAAHHFLLRKPFQDLMRVLVAVAPILVAGLTYNKMMTGSFLEFPYEYVSNPNYASMKEGMGFGAPSLEALWGLTFSPFRGLFFYSPILLVLLGSTKSNFFRQELFTALSLPVFVVFYASYYMWWGGWCYGPRHLIPVSILLTVYTLPHLRSYSLRNTLLVLTGVTGFLMALLAKVTFVNTIPHGHGNPVVQWLWPRAMKSEWQPWNLLSWYWEVDAKLSLILWLVIFALGLYTLSDWQRSSIRFKARSR